MADESIGTARIDIIVNTDQFNAAVTRAKTLTSQMGESGEAAYQKLNKGAKAATTSLLRWAEGLGKTAEEQKLLNAAVRGVPIEALEVARKKVLAQREAMKGAVDGAKELGKNFKEVAFSDAQLLKVNQSLSAFKAKADAAAQAAANLGPKLSDAQFSDAQLLRVNSALASYQAKASSAAQAAETLRQAQAASALQASAAAESERRLQQAEADRQKLVAKNVAAFRVEQANQQRLAQMRADALHAFGPELAARERENAEIQRSNAVRERLTAFLATERGQRIQEAEAIRNQSTAYANMASVQSRAFTGATKSAKELQFAMRSLPAQITDIAVSLQAGQRPLTILLQQGGQLKDMFGGIGPAAKALGSSLLGLINPYTLAAGAVAALGTAWVRAEEDASAFNNALIVTGNYAGKTATQLETMVGSIAHTADVTEGTAREALQKVTESGRFTGETFDLVTTAAARMADATGQSIDDTIKKFEDLGESPVDALLKLNETEHFLTQAQLDRVHALKDEGKEQEAAAEAARIYATRLDDVATAAEAARPHLSKMWKEAKEGASSAWEETKKFADFLAAAAEQYQKMPWYQRLSPIGGLRSSVSALYGAQPSPTSAPVRAVPGAIDSDSARAQIKLQEDAAKLKDQYLTREEEKKRAIAELDRLRSQYTEQEYASLKKQIELRFADKGAARQAKFFDQSIGNDPRADLTADIQKEVDGYKKEADQWARSTSAAVAYRQTLQDMLDTRKRAIDLQVASIGMGKREIDQQAALISIDEDYDRKKADLQKRQQDTTSALEREGYQQQLDDLEKYHDQRVQMEVDGWHRAEEARKNAALGARAAIKDFSDTAGDTAGQTYDLWTNSLQGLTDEMADFFVTGKAGWKDFVKDILKQIAKIQLAKAVAGIASSFAGGYGGTNGNGGVTYNSQGFVSSVYAKGGVVDGSRNLSAYSGSVVDRPTLFAFAKGNGLMGEAGPEAILPLRRGPDGKLGVAAAGGVGGVGDVNVSVTIQQNADGSTAADADVVAASQLGRQLGDQMKATAQRVLQDAMRPGGVLYKSRNGVGAPA